MHFLISFGALAGFVLFSALAGGIGGLYIGVTINRPRKG